MRKLAIIALIAMLFAGCKQGEVRYSQSSPEVDTFKELIAAYEAADWDTYTAKFADTAKVYHNTDDKFMTPAETVAAHKSNTAQLSSFEFVDDKGDIEMVVTDKGETWVNYWGLWKGTLAANGQDVMIPVHVTAQFVEGKVVREYGYWDNGIMMTVMEAIEDAAEAAEDSQEEMNDAED